MAGPLCTVTAFLLFWCRVCPAALPALSTRDALRAGARLEKNKLMALNSSREQFGKSGNFENKQKGLICWGGREEEKMPRKIKTLLCPRLAHSQLENEAETLEMLRGGEKCDPCRL